MKNIQDQKPGEGYKDASGCMTFLIGDGLGGISLFIIVIIILLVFLTRVL